MSEDQTESTIEENKSSNLPGQIAAFYKKSANKILNDYLKPLDKFI